MCAHRGAEELCLEGARVSNYGMWGNGAEVRSAGRTETNWIKSDEWSSTENNGE